MSECIRTEPVAVCFTPTDTSIAPVSLLSHVIYEEGRAIGQALTTADDTETPLDPTAYLGGGTYTAGACQLPQPDVEWIEKCDDVNGDGTDIVKFLCRAVTSFDALGNATTVASNFAMDKTTAYTPANEVPCSSCVLIGSQGTITAWSALS